MNPDRHQPQLRTSADQPPVHAFHSEAPADIPETGRDASTYNPVTHIGSLNGGRDTPYVSYEGRGLSVSQCPDAWHQIMDSAGTEYELRNPNAWFYVVEPTTAVTETEREWALKEDYVEQIDGYRLTLTPDDDSNRDKETFLFRDSADAESEAAGYPHMEADIAPERLYTLGAEGRRYWQRSFEQSPADASPVVIRGLIPVWYAKHLGFDGVWWLDTYDPTNYSAPRGVIFQERLSEWDVEGHNVTF